MSTDDDTTGMADDPDREERRARIRAWLANLPAEVAKVYEDLKRLDPKGQKREK